jgi:hypothetical protein
MGRMKPAWYYQKQAQEAAARATYFQNRVPREDTTVQSRGAQGQAYYQSLNLKLGTNPVIIKVSILQSTLALVSASDAGLKTTLATTESAISRRLIRLKPSKISWYQGDSTPTAQRTEWNTRWLKYYAAGRNTHRSIPVSDTGASFDAQDIQSRFDLLFGPNGSKRGLLGAANGRAWLEMEKVSVTADS